MASERMTAFFSVPKFAVVGANTNRSRFGNRIFRWYLERGLEAFPVNNTLPSVEGVPAVASISSLPGVKDNSSQYSISVVTPPPVTLGVLREAKELGIDRIWLQPGTFDDSVLEYLQENGLQDTVIWRNGACVLVSGDAARAQAGKRSSM